LAYIIYQIAPEVLKDFITNELQFEKTSSIISAGCLYLNVCLVAPIVEEITYRGIIFNRLLTRWGFRVGIYASSFVFAVQHSEMVHAFVFGILMSLLYFKTNNIMVPIIFHIINNSLVTIIEFITDNGDELNISNQDLFIGVVLFLPSLIYLVRYIKQNWPRENTKIVIVDH
jgi:membrane protease YdiL (CAAX protease family)